MFVDVAKVSGFEYFSLNRTISPTLLDLNGKLGQIGGYNGHVPVTGIIAFILVAAGVLQGFNRVLMSNERSANVGNINFNGVDINHQWSKSFEFEKKINFFIKKYISGDFSYLSLLRPLSEIHIVKLFANLRQYHSVFASCNGNFRIGERTKHWCCNCPKCRFVFLALAVHLNRSDLVGIFGGNLLEDEKQLDGFRELCGIKNHRPFECVGEIEESIYAIMNVSTDFRNDHRVRLLRDALSGIDLDSLEKRLFTPSPQHLLTPELENILNFALAEWF
jgi:hypothetical protein